MDCCVAMITITLCCFEYEPIENEQSWSPYSGLQKTKPLRELLLSVSVRTRYIYIYIYNLMSAERIARP